ncbi:MAG: hypothetical protein AAF449_22465 [Myxococcota bacterium]
MTERATPYETLFGHPPDFLVSYRVLTEEEGGRRTPIGQNYRCNWFYGEVPPKSGESRLYSIWPEFLDDDGSVLADKFAAAEGAATMWIPVPRLRPLHRELLRVGVIGFMSEANRPTIHCVVTQILGLHSNPVGD